MREQEEVLKAMPATAGVGHSFQTTITPQNSGDSGEGGGGSPPPDDPPADGDSGEGGGGSPPPDDPPSSPPQ